MLSARISGNAQGQSGHRHPDAVLIMGSDDLVSDSGKTRRPA
jgi:hypothetical protein